MVETDDNSVDLIKWKLLVLYRHIKCILHEQLQKKIEYVPSEKRKASNNMDVW